jgi:NADH-quinone oxidoreductase subunit H
VVFSCALMIAIFFGGWQFPYADKLAASVPNILFVLISFGVWAVKLVAFCSFHLLIRWSLPRFRSDQLMQLGWQRLLPISIANVLVMAAWLLYS